MILVSERHSAIKRSTPRISTNAATGTVGTTTNVGIAGGLPPRHAGRARGQVDQLPGLGPSIQQPIPWLTDRGHPPNGSIGVGGGKGRGEGADVAPRVGA